MARWEEALHRCMVNVMVGEVGVINKIVARDRCCMVQSPARGSRARSLTMRQARNNQDNDKGVADDVGE